MSSEGARKVSELAGFKLLKELGQGGMGKVFLARQTSLDRLVALKVLPPELNGDVEFVQRFEREAKAAALFQHPHVVAVYDQGRDAASGVRFIAFEYVDGGSLEHQLDTRGRLPEAEALAIGRAIAMALEYAEAKDLIHRDVKPENILLTRAGVPKLADLGLAKQAGAAGTNVTQTGVVLGTPLYMAPEQALGEPDLDVRVDLYALGLCLWRTLTGLVPFDEDRKGSSLQILSKHIHQDLPDVRSRAPEVSEGAARVIGWLAARDRTKRYPSAAQAVLDLDRVLTGQAPLGPKDPGSDTTVLYGSPEAKALMAERAAARRASGAHRRPSSGRQQAVAAPAPATRLPHPSVLVIALVLVGALGVGIGLALATGRGRGRGKPPAPPASPTATQTTGEAPTPVATLEPPPPPSPPPSDPAPVVAPTPPAPTPAQPTPPTSAPATTPPTPPPLDPPPVASSTVDVAAIDAALQALEAALRGAPERLRREWTQVRADLADAQVDPSGAAAVAGLTSVLDALVDAVEATPDTRRARHDALARALGTDVAREGPIAGRVAAAVDRVRALVHDLRVVERALGATTAKDYGDLLDALETPEGEGAALDLALRCVRADWGKDADWGLRRLRERPRRVRDATRPKALLPLIDTRDLESVEALKGGQGGPVTALARRLLADGLDAPRGPFVAPRVSPVPASSTGVPLGRPRGLLIVPVRALDGDDQLSIAVDGIEVVVGPDRLEVDGKTRRAPRWPERPALLVEATTPRGPSLVVLDARTGEVVDVERLGSRGRLRFMSVSYTTTVGLESVVVLHPLGGDADPGEDDEEPR